MCCLFIACTTKLIEPERYNLALEKMKSRGPDSTKVESFKIGNRNVFLGFNRLAILDVSSRADQPLSKDNVSIVFNGEIYNFLELRKELEKKKGVIFRTTSDTEVILQLYLEQGISFIEKLRGMFSIVIVDRNLEKIFVVRDRFGIKPLYYLKNEKGVFLSSTIDSLSLFLDKNDINIDYFGRRILLDPFVGFDCDTPFKQIKAILPGTFTEIGMDMVFHTKSYYSIDSITDKDFTNEEIHNLFISSINEHLISDVPVSSTLSGGFDSSLISVLASRKNKNLNIFSVYIDESDNESKSDFYYAGLVYDSIKSNGAVFNKTVVSSDISLDEIDNIVHILGTPIYDQRVFVWNAIYKAVHDKSIKVLLNGQGADELWYGYYPQISLWSWFSYLYHEDLTKENVRKYFINSYRQSALYNMYSNEVLDKFEKNIDKVYDEINSLKNSSSEKKLSVYMLHHVLPSLLAFEDSMSMKNSVEVRVPFMDHRIVEMALSIPVEKHLLKTKKGKDLLKQVFVDYLPSEVINREKSPLPKNHTSDKYITALFDSHLDEIIKSPLVNKLYNKDEILKLTQNKDTGFYGGVGEAKLQILSTWRFEEIYYG
jgi:asparagine synthase (glutamine-hydrolysing)